MRLCIPILLIGPLFNEWGASKSDQFESTYIIILNTNIQSLVPSRSYRHLLLYYTSKLTIIIVSFLI